MLLADTMAAVMIMPAITVLTLLVWHKKQANRTDIFIIGGSLFLTWFTSMTFIYALFLLSLLTLRQSAYHIPTLKQKANRIVKVGLAMLVPYLVFFGFFFLTGGLKEWYFANIFYNQNYYIYNYDRPLGTPVNPIRYTVVITQAFIQNFSQALNGFTNFPLSAPMNAGLAVFVISFLYLFFSRKLYFFGFALIVAFVFACARSNPNNLRNTDYQSAVYILLSLFAGFFTFQTLYSQLESKYNQIGRKVIDGAFVVLVALYLGAVSLFAVNEYRGKMFPKYMGTAPLVYDYTQVADIIDTLVTPNEYAWVGPFEFKENFYMKAKLPSRHHWFLDHAGKIEKIQQELLSDFQTNQPKIIVFRGDYHPWGGKGYEFNTFFTTYLDKNYMNTAEYNKNNPTTKYFWTTPKKGDFELENTVYFKRAEAEQIIAKLVEKNYLHKSP